MTVITHLQRQSRLGKLINRPGGTSVGKAIAEAQANLERFREQALGIISGHIDHLLALSQDEQDARLRLDEAYRASTGIIEAAGLFGMDDLCHAARGLCDLIDAAPSVDRFDWRMPQLYGQAMSLLLSLPEDALEARADVRAGLAEMQQHKMSMNETAAPAAD